MIVFFGIRKKYHVYNARTEHYCPVCKEETPHYLAIQKRAFTVFFIPLIPLGSRKYLVCEKCRHTVKVKEFPPRERIHLSTSTIPETAKELNKSG